MDVEPGEGYSLRYDAKSAVAARARKETLVLAGLALFGKVAPVAAPAPVLLLELAITTAAGGQTTKKGCRSPCMLFCTEHVSASFLKYCVRAFVQPAEDQIDTTNSSNVPLAAVAQLCI